MPATPRRPGRAPGRRTAPVSIAALWVLARWRLVPAPQTPGFKGPEVASSSAERFLARCSAVPRVRGAPTTLRCCVTLMVDLPVCSRRRWDCRGHDQLGHTRRGTSRDPRRVPRPDRGRGPNPTGSPTSCSLRTPPAPRRASCSLTDSPGGSTATSHRGFHVHARGPLPLQSRRSHHLRLQCGWMACLLPAASR